MRQALQTMKTAFGVALIGTLITAQPAMAAESATTTSYPAAPTPAPELALTRAALGTWVCEGVMPAGAVVPGAPPTPYKSSHVFSELLDGFGYRIDYRQDIAGPHPFRLDGREYLGWDKGKNQMVYFWLDSMGTAGQGSSPGWQNGVLTLTGVGAIPVPGPDGKMTPRKSGLRDIYTLREGRLTWQGLVKPEGAPDWVVIGNDSCTREQVSMSASPVAGRNAAPNRNDRSQQQGAKPAVASSPSNSSATKGQKVSEYNYTVAPAEDNPENMAVLAVISRHIAAINAFDRKGMEADFAKDGFLIDAFPPFIWRSPNTTDAWLDDLLAAITPHGLKTVTSRIEGWQRFYVAGDHAYAVADGVSVIAGDAFAVEARGTWTWILQRTDGTWKVAAHMWGGPPAQPIAKP